jgi:hypothetical protein
MPLKFTSEGTRKGLKEVIIGLLAVSILLRKVIVFHIRCGTGLKSGVIPGRQWHYRQTFNAEPGIADSLMAGNIKFSM